MKKVFLDINVVLDVLQERQPDYAASAEILKRIQDGQIHGYICAASYGILHYIMERHIGRHKSIQALKKLSALLKTALLDETVVQDALNGNFEDFADALQYFSAFHAGADTIITRNKRDFRRAELPVYTPEEYLALV